MIMNSNSVQGKRYRKILEAFLIADIIIMVFLAIYYFWGKAIGSDETPYDNAQLVFEDLSDVKVIPSGEAVGIYLKTDGVMVVDTGDVTTSEGQLCCPSKDIIQTGDYIIAVNDESVSTKKELTEAVNTCQGNSVNIRYIRDDEEYTCNITPVKSENNTYMLGLWIKDDISGIGTVTFIMGNKFMALGHSVSDNDTGLMVRSSEGGVYITHITKINKSFVSMPGQLQGTILYRKDLIGIIEKNMECGISGYLDEDYISENYDSSEALYVAAGDEVECGKAYIYSRMTGELKKYEINIEKVDYTSSSKNIEFEVTDQELLELTGGVIQGMSGSPIIQNDKVIGAVTHVLVDEPTNGYGIFVETMLEK
jgi:stage IV sporulation protein B